MSAAGDPRRSLRKVRRGWILAAVAALAAPAVARAQPSDTQARVQGEALFNAAIDLMSAARFREACPKLEEVTVLVPSAIGAKEKLGECYESEGKLASAFATYRAAAALAEGQNQPDRAVRSSASADAIEPRLSYITILLPLGVDAATVHVRQDGHELSAATVGVRMAIDGGQHLIEASAPNRVPFRESITVLPEHGDTTVSVQLPIGPVDQRGDSDARSTRKMTAVRMGGIVVGALGLAGGIAGVIVGATGVASVDAAADDFNQSQTDANLSAEATARADHEDARFQTGLGWTIAGVCGGAVVAGIVMVALGGSSSAAKQAHIVPWWNHESGGLILRAAL